VIFAREIQGGTVVGAGNRFSTRDPQIVQIVTWNPDSLSVGTRLAFKWIDHAGRVTVEGQTAVEQGSNGWQFTVRAPSGGFPATRVEAQVSVNGAIVAREQFTIE
jgi:hypothetical protein